MKLGICLGGDGQAVDQDGGPFAAVFHTKREHIRALSAGYADVCLALRRQLGAGFQGVVENIAEEDAEIKVVQKAGAAHIQIYGNFCPVTLALLQLHAQQSVCKLVARIVVPPGGDCLLQKGVDILPNLGCVSFGQQKLDAQQMIFQIVPEGGNLLGVERLVLDLLQQRLGFLLLELGHGPFPAIPAGILHIA